MRLLRKPARSHCYVRPNGTAKSLVVLVQKAQHHLTYKIVCSCCYEPVTSCLAARLLGFAASLEYVSLRKIIGNYFCYVKLAVCTLTHSKDTGCLFRTSYGVFGSWLYQPICQFPAKYLGHRSLWSPYVIGQTIIFLPCDFYPSFFLSSFFFFLA